VINIDNKKIKPHIALYKIHKSIKAGYDEYNLYFVITSISVIIGGFFGVGGIMAWALTLFIFYWLGHLNKHIERKIVDVKKS